MEGVKKLARSQSIKLCEALRIPVTKDSKDKDSVSPAREEARAREEAAGQEADSAAPTQLPILRSFHSTSKEMSDKTKTNGVSSPCPGLVQYEDMLTLLTCLHCGNLVNPPTVQCRKGHLYCSSCKSSNHLTSCKICKQTFVEAPNQALEKMITLIGVPCKYGARGCTEVVFLPSRLQHESICRFRPIECQNQQHGCQAVFAYKDMCWHHKMCQFAHHPHPNVLPAMPERKKAQKKTDSSLDSDTSTKASSPDISEPLQGPSRVPFIRQDSLLANAS